MEEMVETVELKVLKTHAVVEEAVV
jgi:hypothetical protein